MATEDTILLKLIIQGQNPEEIQRLAASTQGQLNDRMKTYIDHLTQLHRKAAEDQTAEEKKKVKASIDAAEKQIEVIQKVARANEIAANRASGAWHRALEDAENLTTVLRGQVAFWDGVIGKVKSFADEMLRVSQVLNAPGGGDAAFAISGLVGDISAYDIAAVRNKALQQELTLSKEDFVTLAAAASELADQLGTNAKDALETFTDAMATGRTRTLALIGINVDAENVYKKLADSIGKTVDQLTEAEKKLALQKEIMDQVAKKAPEVGKEISTIGDAFERSINNATNAWHYFLTSIANAKVPNWVKEIISSNPYLGAAGAALGAAFPGITGETQDLIDAAAKKRLSATAESYLGGASQDDLIPLDETDAYLKNRMGAGLGGQKIKSKDITEELKRKAEEARKNAADPLQSLYDKRDRSEAIGEDLLPFAGIDQGGAEEFAKESEAKAESYEKLQAKVRDEAQKTADHMGAILEQVAKRKEELNATAERAGGGLFAMVLFGPDGPDKTYDEMDSFQQATVDMAGTISESMHVMAEAVAADLANWIANTQAGKKSIRDLTNEMLVALSTKAFVKGLEALAEAAGNVARYNFPAAAANLEEAAAWGALGAATGLAARAVGHSAPASSGSGISGGRSAPGGYYGSNYSAGAGGDSRGPLTINLTVLPGGEAEAGRAIDKALNAFYAQTGKGRAAA